MAFDAAIIPSLLGLGGKIAGAIPGLKKPKRTHAGGRAAARAASQANAAAVGAAQAGHGASRGLALREGLRSAATQVAAASGQAADAAQRDEAAFQAQLTARNERIADFASGTAEGLAQMTQGFIQPKGAAGGTIEGQPELQGSETGLGTPAAGTPEERPALASSTEGLQDPAVQDLDQMEQDMVQKNIELAEQDDPRVSGPHADFASTKRLEQLRAKSPTVAAPQIEAYLGQRLRAKKLMLQDAERLGLDLGTMLPMINRQLDLKPGQGAQNPFGVSLDPGDQGEE